MLSPQEDAVHVHSDVAT